MIWQTDLDLTEQEKEKILRQANELTGGKEKIYKIHVWQDADGFLAFQPYYARKINRIRRITGYFSKIENFNDAKKAELYDRVAHI